MILQGVPMTFEGKMKVTTLEGTTQYVSQGPTAAIVPIKQLGTNGGGFFGANSTHPLENPSYLTNMIECASILLIPMAMVFAFGFYTNRRRLGYSIFGVMLFAYLAGVVVNMHEEMAGNPCLAQMGISQHGGAMEGKEVRFGTAATALWSVSTTATSNGSVNGMHDSMMPLSGMVEMLNMQINTWFGGVGVGWMNYFTFVIIAVFISGLMVGRTPEFLGKKVEAREMKIASIVALLHPFLILAGTALAAWLWVRAPQFVAREGGWLCNNGYHGLSEMLYEFTSSAANNGSGFEGLGDNTWFWNISSAVVMLLGRYVPIIGQVAIAGLLAGKKFTPEGAGTLRTDTATFSLMTFAVIFIVAALSFFPAQALSTLAEYLSI
jgi:K+-transporting ATPase ATPase A chain